MFNASDKVDIKIVGMSCEHCKQTVEKELESLEGVSKAEVTLEKGEVNVVYDSKTLTIEDLHSKIKDAGYEVIS